MKTTPKVGDLVVYQREGRPLHGKSGTVLRIVQNGDYNLVEVDFDGEAHPCWVGNLEPAPPV